MPVTGSFFIYHGLHTVPPTIYILAYSISSLALNLTATGFIAGRLLAYRHRIVSQLGRGHGHHYVGIAAVVVESAAIYTGFLLIVIVAYALQSPATNLLQQIIWHVQVSNERPSVCSGARRIVIACRVGSRLRHFIVCCGMAPQMFTSLLIIWRIARGEGWSRSTGTKVMSTVASSSNTRVGPQSEPGMFQLEVVSIRRDEEEGSIRRKEDGSKFSFPNGGEE